LLLEVLIAFALVILCALPLIYPHVYMVKEQKKFLQQVELDRTAHLVYGDILEKLYLNQIPWNALVQGTRFPIAPSLLAGQNPSLPLAYIGTYHFSEVKHKPSNPAAARTIWLWDLNISFVPVEYQNAPDDIKKEQSIIFIYKVFIVRDLKQGEVSPSPDPAKGKTHEKPPTK
jgi:hypothetical protein